MANSKPYVILSAAMSMDGKIATRKGESKFSSSKDLARVHRLRGSVDAILVGRNTVSVDNPSLTVRHAKGRNPLRIILDPKATISPSSKIVKTSKKIHTMAIVSETAPSRRVSILAKKGLEVIKCGKIRIDLKKLLSILAKRGIRKILVEGGGTTNWYFLKEKLVDEIIVTITPYVVGGKESVSLVEGHGFDKISYPLKLKQVKRMGSEIILHYTI
ncbi:2,5-diamino-6-(ribosylamino)-4(3H)-pyrimidinone 5'-phosphate reductase [Candidatus Nitrosotalea sp. TS]|uniref:2,5-diamino-6-(ribosylamino)-4(3H)-pyrimidinone 5'-phosphate reductase n=1 Tax=Candidatus Nitrosotalea sp. TS TaxID=2341020 RepID=UPI00140DDC78|nr:2,5-diamino-6-(ribosylamino)-4(3H)-pyrimidinone 5'-phosphate reductase [Candidatus Nitrosotalea sp. TS]